MGQPHRHRAGLALNLVLLPALAALTVAGALLAPLAVGAARVLAGRPAPLTTRWLVWRYGRACVWLVSRFVPLRTSRLERIGEAAPCIIVANHQSFLDLHILGAMPTPNLVMVVKGWPFRIPLYGWFMRRAGYLNSDELGQETLLRLGGEALASGASIIFFPEGARSRDGRLGRFRSGAFKLAVDTGRPLAPVCLSGVGRLLPPGRFLLGESSIAVEALPSVDPAPYRDAPAGHGVLRRAVRAALAEKLAAPGQAARAEASTTLGGFQ
ncbi:MAG: lysophospholipid acyltransferase family protein [Thermodesulfobacteriota bacterium]